MRTSFIYIVVATMLVAACRGPQAASVLPTGTSAPPTATNVPTVTNTPEPQVDIENLFDKITEGDIVNDGGMSRGVAWGDYNGDGFADLFVTNSSQQNNFLYQNNGAGSFIKITTGELVELKASSESGNWVDIENDGDLDLFVANLDDQANFLFQNDGSGNFTRIMEGEIVTETFASTGSCWIDLENDGDLDVFITNRNNQDNSLFLNDGSGNFTRVDDSILVSDGGDSRACGWADIDNDGDWDLFVGNAHQRNFLYLNNGDGTFSKIADTELTARIDYTYGLSWADVDGDGDLDLFVANVIDGSSRYNELFLNDGAGNFSRVDQEPITTDVGPSKGNAWGDFDNDGDLDLFVANGTPNRDVRNFLYLNQGFGIFTRVDISFIAQDNEVSAGVALADYDNNGTLDIFVANWENEDQNNTLYKNTNTVGNWVELSLHGVQSNRFGVGALARVHAIINGEDIWQERIILNNTGYGSQNSLVVHFGLGSATKILEIEIHWPSGIVDLYSEPNINSLYIAVEGEGVLINQNLP